MQAELEHEHNATRTDNLVTSDQKLQEQNDNLLVGDTHDQK